MVWRCRRQRVQRFFLRCYKKDFGEKRSRTRYRFKRNLSCVRIQDAICNSDRERAERERTKQAETPSSAAEPGTT